MSWKLPGSQRVPPFPSTDASPDVDPWPDDWPCQVTVFLQPVGGHGVVEAAAIRDEQAQANTSVARRSYLDQKALCRLLAADSNNRSTAEGIFRAAGAIDVVRFHSRALRLSGTWAELSKVFHVDYRRFSTPDGTVVGRTGPIEVMDGRLQGLVTAVFGLDNRRTVSPYVIKSHVIKSHVIKSHVIKSHAITRPAGGLRKLVRAEWQEELARRGRTWLTPKEVASRYTFPRSQGRGCRVGVLAFSGRQDGAGPPVRGGYDAEALNRFLTNELGLGRLRLSKPCVIRGPGNWPGDGSGPNDFTDEVMLDLTVVGALASEADFTVYFTEPTEQGFVEALHHVVELPDADLPDVLLICYGSPENAADGSSWTQAAIAECNLAFAAAALRGVPVVCSCGDNGAADAPLSTRVHADFPASSPWVLGCGGTSLRRQPRRRERSEIVWNDGRGASGGGISAVIGRPAWQQGVAIPTPVDGWMRPGFDGRGVPDVAALADPATGMPVVDAMDDTVVVGGTSVSAPIWAALLARCLTDIRPARPIRGRPRPRLVHLAPAIWRGCGGVTDVAVGDNGAYVAVPAGWDPCTGWGVPDGSVLCRALR